MAVLLRSRGVPTRNVTGFVGGTFNRFSRNYAVRQGDAHSWVEVYLEGSGWTRFDPTPPSSTAPRSEIGGALVVVRDLLEALGQRWNRHVIGYDLKQQVWLFHGVRDAYGKIVPERDLTSRLASSPRRSVLTVLALCGVIFAVRELVLRRRKKGPGPDADPDELRAREVVELYQALDRAMSACGVTRPSGTPPLTHARALAAMGHWIGQEVLELTELYVAARFGGRVLSDDELRDFARRVRALRLPKQEKTAA